MQLFIGNLPRTYSAFELRRLVEHHVMPQGIKETAKHFLFPKERIKRAEYDVFDKLTHQGIVRHGKVIVEPENMAYKVIDRMHGMEYQRRILIVREWHVRANNNDRRALNWRLRSWNAPERRQRDRRQPTVDLRRQRQQEFA